MSLCWGTELMQQIGEMPDATEDEVRRSISRYSEADEVLAPFKHVMDVWTSEHFGNTGARSLLIDEISSADADKLLRGNYGFKKHGQRGIAKAMDLSDSKRFFHWELEFPEVFYDGAEERENPGFGAVVGNPPYDVLAQKEVGVDTDIEVLYYRSEKRFESSLGGKLNYYKLFTVASTHLSKYAGRCGLIMPLSIVGDKSALALREYLLSKMQIEVIEAFPQKDRPKERVFEDAKLSTCIILWRKQHPAEKFIIRTHPGRYIEVTSWSSQLSYEDVRLFDPEQLNIPNLSQQELDIVLRLSRDKRIARFSDYADVVQGEINLTADAEHISTVSGKHRIIRGAQVLRYQVTDTLSQGEPLFLDKEKRPWALVPAREHRPHSRACG
jgi:hypothetical protein